MASEGAAELDEAGLDAWLSREPEPADDTNGRDPDAPEPPPRQHGVVFEGSVGAWATSATCGTCRPYHPGSGFK